VPFEAPNSVIMAFKPYCLSQAVSGARFVGPDWVQLECDPEKSESRYSWMSRAVLFTGSVILYITALEAGEFPV
jgi:hypothetical protein